jgi:hypothetical protein
MNITAIAKSAKYFVLLIFIASLLRPWVFQNWRMSLISLFIIFFCSYNFLVYNVFPVHSNFAYFLGIIAPLLGALSFLIKALRFLSVI